MSPRLHARLATGLTVAEREASFTRTDSVVRWSREGRAAYEAETEKLWSSTFFFLTGASCSNQAENNHMRGDGDYFLNSDLFGSIFIVFAALLCRAVLSLSYVQHIKRSKYPTRDMYARTACGVGLFPGWSMELLAFANRLFAPNGLNRMFRSIFFSS